MSGLILLLTYNFISIGNSTMLDVPMIFLILCGILYFIKAGKKIDQGYLFFISGLFIGSAFLIKGVVSLPVWGAIFIYVLIWKRELLTKWRFYQLPIGILFVIGLFLLVEYISNDGHFASYYFGVHVLRSLKGTNVVVKPEWYKFTLKFVTLYLPFSILIPLGLYYAYKKKVYLIYLISLSLLMYVFFHSIADKLFYHYFISTYALSALIAALPLYYYLKPKFIDKIKLYFLISWTILAVVITVVDFRIHQIRSPEIYDNASLMNEYLTDEIKRDGLIITAGKINWDFVAKTTWYWRSDLLRIPSLDIALDSLKSSNQFVYILATPDYYISDYMLTKLKLDRLLSDRSIEIYINQ